MTNRSTLLAGLLSLSLSLSLCSLVACAGDPNKQANDAHDAELKSERKQLQETAGDRSETRVEAAEMKRDNTDAVASGNGSPAATSSNASTNATLADAKLTEAREIFRAKATERLEKLDARTSELRQLVDRAGGKASTASRDALKTVDTQRSQVTSALDQLPRVSGDGFKQAKTSLDTQLDTLDGLVKKAADEVSKFKK